MGSLIDWWLVLLLTLVSLALYVVGQCDNRFTRMWIVVLPVTINDICLDWLICAFRKVFGLGTVPLDGAPQDEMIQQINSEDQTTAQVNFVKEILSVLLSALLLAFLVTVLLSFVKNIS